MDAPKQMGYAILFCPPKIRLCDHSCLNHMPYEMKGFSVILTKAQHSGPRTFYTYPLFSNNSLPATSPDDIATSPLPQEKQNKGLSFLLPVSSSSGETLSC